MKRYIYSICVANQRADCHTVGQVAHFINSATGVPLVSPHIILNYFTRPHLANKRLFHNVDGAPPFIQLQRTVVTPTSSSPKECKTQ
eukprot:COSAG05_NODE_4075_length_1685_cov_1.432535_2_plen_87_part_00